MSYASDQGDLNRFIENEKSMAYPVEVSFIIQNTPSKWTGLGVKNMFVCVLPSSARSRMYLESIALTVAWQSLKAATFHVISDQVSQFLPQELM